MQQRAVIIREPVSRQTVLPYGHRCTPSEFAAVSTYGPTTPLPPGSGYWTLSRLDFMPALSVA